MERTFVMLKPDAVERGLVGEIIGRIERKGLRIAAMKMIAVSSDRAEKLYAEHKGKDFYDRLMDFITSGRVVVMVVEGDAAITHVRNLMGATNPKDAMPGTIRGDFVTHVTRNTIHGCDSAEKAEREISLFFKPDEIH